MQHAILTVDLGFGDAGKGSIIDALTRTYDAHTIIRYNGGAQAGHRVVTSGSQPQEHVFAQFGSGTLAGAATHLSRFMLLDPLAMTEEAKHLQALGVDAFGRTTIDEGALVITPIQRAINRLKELARGAARHGSCGMGIGETMADHLEHGDRILFAGDLRHPDVLQAKLRFLHTINMVKLDALRPDLPATEQVERELAWLVDPDWADWLVVAYRDFVRSARIVSGAYLRTILQRPGTVIFEGAQGVLLDEWHGFHPHTTWSTTTLSNADDLLGDAGYNGSTTRIGMTRGYTTRHGAGPLVTEDAPLTAALPDPRNSFDAWQQGFRVGWLDLVLLRYAREIVGPLDYLAVTCLDRLAALPEIKVCRRYRYDSFVVERIAPSVMSNKLAGQEQITCNLAHCAPIVEAVPDVAALLDLVTHELELPIGMISTGPTAADKQLLNIDRKIIKAAHRATRVRGALKQRFGGPWYSNLECRSSADEPAD